MPDNLAIMAREAVAIGPTGRRLAANVLALRRARQLNQPQLAQRMQDCGRAVHATVVSKIEGLDRRVDVDDLVALAIALDVSPSRLLLTASASDDCSVALTPDLDVPEREAWLWASGAVPLGSLSPAQDTDWRAENERRAQFVKENRPQGVDSGFVSSYLPGRPAGTGALLADLATTLTNALESGVNAEALHKLVDLAASLATSGAPGSGVIAQPVVAAIVTSAKGVLVTRRKDGRPPWGFVAGEVHKDPAERPEDAAVREVKEETGLEVRTGMIIGERPHPATGRHMVYIAAEPVRDTHVFVGDDAELAEVRWVSLAEADELMPDMFGPVRDYLSRTLKAGDR